jgi:integrase
MGLGSYPDMSLKKARELTEAARSQVAEGVDPKLAREEERAAQRYSENATLRKVAEEWFEIKKSEVTADYADDIWRSLELHVFNRLGETPVSQISAQTVIDVLRPVEKTGRLETVKRVIQRLSEIMNYAVIKNLITGNPIVAIKSAFKKPKKQHLPTITAEELPDFLKKLHDTNVTYITRQVIKWQLLTMTRPSEAAGAKWSEIQWLDDGQVNWVIPAERMKKRRQHAVPLCEQALKVLEDMKSVSDQYEHIFISLRKPQTPINSQTANMALRRMGYQDKLVSHGLRALASTIMNEEGKDPQDKGKQLQSHR